METDGGRHWGRWGDGEEREERQVPWGRSGGGSRRKRGVGKAERERGAVGEVGRVKGGSATFFSFLSSRAWAGSARQGQVVMGLPGVGGRLVRRLGLGVLMAEREKREGGREGARVGARVG